MSGNVPVIHSLEFVNFNENIPERPFFTLVERVSRVAIRTTQIARGQPHKNAGQSGEGAFALDAQINFVDDERVAHARNFVESLNRYNVETIQRFTLGCGPWTSTTIQPFAWLASSSIWSPTCCKFRKPNAPGSSSPNVP